MEIKTSVEIYVETKSSKLGDGYDLKKWVAVEDINTWLDGYFLKNNSAVRELTNHLKDAIKQ